MLNITIKKLIEITGGTVLSGDIGKYGEYHICRISYDSRDTDRDTLFVPLIGEKVDSHKFIHQVFAGDGVVSLSQQDILLSDSNKILIRVNDTVNAVKIIAEYCRNKIHIPVIGITGSVGKTSTREMIAAALSSSRSVFATPGNKNSQLGTPVTLCGFDDNAEVAVLEMGISLPGEMSRLSEMVRPDIAVFTNIGITHIENLGSREGILSEKMHILDHMCPGSAVFINDDNDMLHNAAFPEELHVFRYALNHNCDAYAEDISESDGHISFTAVINGKKVPVILGIPGRHHIYNALAALAVCDYYGLDIVLAADKLKSFKGYSHRGQIFHNKGITIIDDTYNAAPDSMKAAIDILSSMSCKGRRIAVLADMKELGSNEVEEHKSVGRYIADKGNIDLLLTYGPLAENMSDGTGISDFINFSTSDQLEKELYKILKQGDAVLFKGSNSMGLFNMVEKVMNHEFC